MNSMNPSVRHPGDNKSDSVLHFVGIGGIGMSGIAEVFLNRGYPVTGSDLLDSDSIQKLIQLGARITLGHHPENIQSATVVVMSSAIEAENPEIIEAKRRRIPVIRRAEMLGELMRGKIGISIAGSHGKTTTTSMVGTILTHAQYDPTLVIGGKVDSFGGNAKMGQGSIVVAEADESDGSFRHLPTTFGVVTNIGNDHLDYFKTLSAIEDAFVEFVGELPFYGMAMVCGDDPGVRRCAERWTKPVQTYGFGPECTLRARRAKLTRLGSSFWLHQKSEKGGASERTLGLIRLRVPGRHNILNALASIGIALRLGVDFGMIADALGEFRGVKRRFEVLYANARRRLRVIDDYGHHPTEISATLATARAHWSGRIICVFQPHRYSRTHLCLDGFLSAFTQSDILILTDIYSAGERPIAGVDSLTLSDQIRSRSPPHQEVIYGGSLPQILELLFTKIVAGDLILFHGAGSITTLAHATAERLRRGH